MTERPCPPNIAPGIWAEFARTKNKDGKRDPPLSRRNSHDARVPKRGDAPALLAAPDRDRLMLSAWLDRDIPDRDYLLGNVMCTTSRWFVIGETGIGKTLFGGALTCRP
jgi:hypothetical protein